MLAETQQRTDDIEAHAEGEVAVSRSGGDEAADHGARASDGRRRDHVRFTEGRSNCLAILETESPQRGGLLSAVSRALLAGRVQVVRFDTDPTDSGACSRFHLAELDGAPLTGRRWREIQSSILDAIDGAPTRFTRLAAPWSSRT